MATHTKKSFFKNHPHFTRVLLLEAVATLAYSLSYIEPKNAMINVMNGTTIDFNDLGKLDLGKAHLNIGIITCVIGALLLLIAYGCDKYKQPRIDRSAYEEIADSYDPHDWRASQVTEYM